MPNQDDQVKHWNAIQDSLKDANNVLIETVNENDGSGAKLDIKLFPNKNDLLVSSGSNGSQATPVRPWKKYETFHTNDAFEWWRKAGHNAMEFSTGTTGIEASHVPVIADENTRGDSNVNHYEDAAKGAALLSAGIVFHCDGCRYSEELTDNEIAGAIATVKGARSVDLSCQDGEYKLRNDLLNDTLSRVYQRFMGDVNTCIVEIRK